MSDKGKMLVYVIDDSDFICQLATSLEHFYENVKVETYTNAEQGVMQCNLNKPHLIFLDYYLDDRSDLARNGDTVLKYIRHYLPDVKVVLLTNLSDSNRIDELLHLGVDGFIHKSEGDLIERMLTCISNFYETRESQA